MITCAIDTELLGHWWYEGLALAARGARRGRAPGRAARPGERRGRRRRAGRARAERRRRWGRPKDLTTWDSPPVADFAWTARDAELRTLRQFAAATGDGNGHGPAFERAARELLALQASDWAFQVTHDLAGDYPARRVAAHAEALDAALAALTDSAPVPDPTVRNLAPGLDLSPLSQRLTP